MTDKHTPTPWYSSGENITGMITIYNDYDHEVFEIDIYNDNLENNINFMLKAVNSHEANKALESEIEALKSHNEELEKENKELREEACLVHFIDEKYEWSKKTFGEGYRVDALIAHIQKELEEIQKSPKDISEWIDVILLALDGASRAGFSGAQIVSEIFKKQTINQSRQWPDHKSIPEGQPIEHVRQP